MSILSSVESKLPPGFRFHPSDEELVCDYLMKRVTGRPAHPLLPLLIQVDLHKCEPWDLPETARVVSKEWYFYTQRDRKYATGLRTNRATLSGYWKATGKDRKVSRRGKLVGMRKTLVFYQGRAPKGRKSDWVMHEYRLEGTNGPSPKSFSPVKEDWVLCRVFFKNTTLSPNKFQESGKSKEITASSPSLPPLMEPCSNSAIAFDPTHASSSGLLNEHVPGFSIFSTNQTTPTFFPLTHMGPPEGFSGTLIMPSPIGHFGTYDNPSLSAMNNYPSPSYDDKGMKAVLRKLAKINGANDSPIYVSEAVLSPVWNQYS